MTSLTVKARKDLGKKVKNLRDKGILPGVLYGPKTESIPLEIDLKEFEKVFKTAGESSLITLNLGTKKFLVLVHSLELDVLSKKPRHVDFYQPNLDEEITADIPLVFEGEAPAIKDLGGTLVKNIHELEIKALPQNLIHEIKIDISKLKTFEDKLLVKDLEVPKEVKILKDPEAIIAFVSQLEKIEEELEKPIEEKVDQVEKVEEKKKEEEVPEAPVKEKK